jgi:hypothetical protein
MSKILSLNQNIFLSITHLLFIIISYKIYLVKYKNNLKFIHI